MGVRSGYAAIGFVGEDGSRLRLRACPLASSNSTAAIVSAAISGAEGGFGIRARRFVTFVSFANAAGVQGRSGRRQREWKEASDQREQQQESSGQTLHVVLNPEQTSEPKWRKHRTDPVHDATAG